MIWLPELLNTFARIKSWYFRVFEISSIARNNEILHLEEKANSLKRATVAACNLI